MALLIFLTIAMAHGASEEFWKGKLEQLTEDLKENAQSLQKQTRRVKEDAASDGTTSDGKDWWDTSFNPKLQKQIDLVNELEEKLHQYRHVSQEVQIAEKASFGPFWWCFGACVLVVVFFCGWRFGDEVLECLQVRKKAAAPNTEPFLGPNDKEQSARDGASHASGCSHSESGDSHSSWDKI